MRFWCNGHRCTHFCWIEVVLSGLCLQCSPSNPFVFNYTHQISNTSKLKISFTLGWYNLESIKILVILHRNALSFGLYCNVQNGEGMELNTINQQCSGM